MLHVPTTRKVAATGTRFTTAYVAAPVCAPSRSCLASGREYDAAGVLSNFANDYPVNQTTFYAVMRANGYHTMTTGKDDLTKASQLGSKIGYPGCPQCRDGDGQYHLKELGFSDALRYSGKMDVVDKPDPHEMYGFYLRNHSVALSKGNNITGWEAHRACMGKASVSECVNSTFTPALYEDDFTAINAVILLQRKPAGVPWFLHVSFPGPHDPFFGHSRHAKRGVRRSQLAQCDGRSEAGHPGWSLPTGEHADRRPQPLQLRSRNRKPRQALPGRSRRSGAPRRDGEHNRVHCFGPRRNARRPRRR